MSRICKRIVVGIVLILATVLIGLPFIMGQSELGLSTELEITNFFFCAFPDQEVNGYTQIEVLSIERFKDGLYICGYAVTDGRPASINILIYQTNNQKKIFELPVGETVSTGFFSYFVPKDSINQTGQYKAQIIHGRPLPIIADILIQP